MSTSPSPARAAPRPSTPTRTAASHTAIHADAPGHAPGHGHGHAPALAERLRRVDWAADPWDHPARARAAFLVEHLRRAALWTRGTPRDGWPWPDIAAAIDPSVRADDALVQRVTTAPHFPGPSAARACGNALHLAALRDRAVPLPELPDPYAPLIRLFECGGPVHADCSGLFLDVGGASVPFRPADRFLGLPARTDAQREAKIDVLGR